ncbi:hypothetical protein [Streptomyces bacillaris]|uniref:hypothetical protein n=1 Tax=Streptomyces bacillaris TaxID=68179 RepID=UPI00296E7019
MLNFPAPADAREPWEGEGEALAVAAEAGLRAAAWVRSLPGPAVACPIGSWLAWELPEAIETAMGSLDPSDEDAMGPDGVVVPGRGGVTEEVMETLMAVPCVLSEADWLSAEQQLRLVAVASVAAGCVRLVVTDAGTAILHGLLARMCASLTYASRPDAAG